MLYEFTEKKNVFEIICKILENSIKWNVSIKYLAIGLEPDLARSLFVMVSLALAK